MSYTSLAQSAADWVLSKVGCAYSQAQRTQENIFDCSSLVAIPYSMIRYNKLRKFRIRYNKLRKFRK